MSLAEKPVDAHRTGCSTPRVVLSDAWKARVRTWCDPVFEAADCGFVRNPQGDALLWEADPARFAERYPDSGILESYGGDLDRVHCIDFWVYLDQPGVARISVEGWDLPTLHVELSGWPDSDGRSLAALFGRVLGVPVPEAPSE